MRRCLPIDLIEAAAFLAASPRATRVKMAEILLDQADAAHRFFKRFSRPHALWGNGSLASRVLVDSQTERQPTETAEYFAALSTLAAALARRKGRSHPESC